MRELALICLLICLPLMASCGGGDPSPTPTRAPTQTATSIPATATVMPPARIEPIVWATAVTPGSNVPATPVEQFTSTANTLYAVVRVSNLRAGAVLTASWAYNDTSLDTATQAVTLPNAFEAGYVEFHLTRSGQQPWPTGTYRVSVSLDGQIVQTSQIEMVAS